MEHDFDSKMTFRVFIDCVYQRGRYGEHRVARHGYAADTLFIGTPRGTQEHYHKRFNIGSSYRLAKQSLVFTSSQGAGLRLLTLSVYYHFGTADGMVTGGAWRRSAESGTASGSGCSRSFCLLKGKLISGPAMILR